MPSISTITQNLQARKCQTDRYTVAVGSLDKEIFPLDIAGGVVAVSIQLQWVREEDQGANEMRVDVDRLVMHTTETGD